MALSINRFWIHLGIEPIDWYSENKYWPYILTSCEHMEKYRLLFT